MLCSSCKFYAPVWGNADSCLISNYFVCVCLVSSGSYLPRGVEADGTVVEGADGATAGGGGEGGATTTAGVTTAIMTGGVAAGGIVTATGVGGGVTAGFGIGAQFGVWATRMGVTAGD